MKSRKLIWIVVLSILCFISICISIVVVSNGRKSNVEKMTEEELIEVVLDDTYFINLFLVNDSNIAVKGLSERSEALCELLTRDNVEQALMSAIQIRDPARVEMQRDGLEMILNYVRKTIRKEE